MAFKTYERNIHELNDVDDFLNDPKIRFYFNQLDSLGDISKVYPAKNLDKINVGLIKVGAKPLSGIRGLYFTRGMWKVKFLDNDYDVITCIFRYYDKESLIKSYRIAHLFLKKVILYKRHIHEDDGTVLEQLDDCQLVELDRRKSKDSPENRLRQLRQGETRFRRNVHAQQKLPKRPRSPTDDTAELVDFIRQNVKKKKKRLNGAVNVNQVKSQGVLKEKPRKLTKFESKFLKYCSYSTIDMINHIMDQNRESRLSDHGKTYSIRHRLYDAKSKDSGDDSKQINSNGLMFPYLNEISRDELLRRTSLKLDFGEDLGSVDLRADCNKIASITQNTWDSEDYDSVKSYNFEN